MNPVANQPADTCPLARVPAQQHAHLHLHRCGGGALCGLLQHRRQDHASRRLPGQAHPDTYTCQELRKYAKCDMSFMQSALAAQWQGGFCQRTCRRCSCAEGSGAQCATVGGRAVLAWPAGTCMTLEYIFLSISCSILLILFIPMCVDHASWFVIYLFVYLFIVTSAQLRSRRCDVWLALRASLQTVHHVLHAASESGC
jgi:hypothetical protein